MGSMLSRILQVYALWGVYSHGKSPIPSHHLLRSVSRLPLITVYVPHSPTSDQTGKGVYIFLGKASPPMCPMLAVVNYLAIRPSPPGPLFVFANGAPLTRERFVKEVKSALKEAGVDNRAYFGHSFRIGAATSAA